MLFHSTEKLRSGTLLYFTKLLVSISFYGKEWGEGGRISIFRKTLSVPENFVGQPFKVSMISGIENFCGHGGGGRREFHEFLLKISCLTVPKIFIEEHFCVSEIFWCRKTFVIRDRVGITKIRRNCFV